jgi:hypothetical protein
MQLVNVAVGSSGIRLRQPMNATGDHDPMGGDEAVVENQRGFRLHALYYSNILHKSNI